MKTKDLNKRIETRWESFDEQAVGHLSNILSQQMACAISCEVRLTELLRRSDTLDAQTALEAMHRNGVVSLTAANLWKIARSGSRHFSEWTRGVLTSSEMAKCIDMSEHTKSPNMSLGS